MTVSANDQLTLTQRLEKAKEANTTDLVVDGFFFAVYGGALAVVAATGAGPAWLMATQVMLGSKGIDIVGNCLKRQSLKQATRDIGQDPSGQKVRDKVARLKSFSKKSFIAGAVIWGVSLAAFCSLAAAAPIAAPLFCAGLSIILAGGLSKDMAKGAQTVVEAVDAVSPPAPRVTPVPAVAPAAPSKVAGMSAGPSFTAAANDDKGAAPAPAAEKTVRSFRTFDF